MPEEEGGKGRKKEGRENRRKNTDIGLVIPCS